MHHDLYFTAQIRVSRISFYNRETIKVNIKSNIRQHLSLKISVYLQPKFVSHEFLSISESRFRFILDQKIRQYQNLKTIKITGKNTIGETRIGADAVPLKICIEAFNFNGLAHSSWLMAHSSQLIKKPDRLQVSFGEPNPVYQKTQTSKK